MTEFALDLVAFGDVAGLGAYEAGHFRQHLNYVNALAKRGIFLPVMPVMNLIVHNPLELEGWLNMHENWHQLLREHTRVSGVNLADMNPNNQFSFYDWQQNHAVEHRAIDRRLGL